MTRNWIAANLVLLAVAGLLGWQLNSSIKRFNADSDLSKLQPVKDLKQSITQDSGGLPAFAPPKKYRAADFATIPQQNLFSETRAKEEKVETPVVQEVPALQVKPILVGVTIKGEQRLASIVDPSSSGGARKSRTKRIGDSYQGYTVTDITENQMVLESGHRKEVIPLFDSSKHNAKGGGGKTPILPTRIVSFGAGAGGAAGGGSPVSTPSPVRPVAQASAAAGGPRPATPPAKTTPVAAPQPATPAQATPAGETTNPQGQRVIRTPFGDIVRPN